MGWNTLMEEEVRTRAISPPLLSTHPKHPSVPAHGGRAGGQCAPSSKSQAHSERLWHHLTTQTLGTIWLPKQTLRRVFQKADLQLIIQSHACEQLAIAVSLPGLVSCQRGINKKQVAALSASWSGRLLAQPR